MKSKDPKNIPEGRYTAAHLEYLQKVWLYAWFCEMAELGTVTSDTVRVLDTEIEPKLRVRRSCIVDLIRDKLLIPPDAIATRGDKLYRIDENILNAIAVPGEEASGELHLGMCFDRDIVSVITLGRMRAFFSALLSGDAEIFWETIDGIRFAKVAAVENSPVAEEVVVEDLPEIEAAENFPADDS